MLITLLLAHAVAASAPLASVPRVSHVTDAIAGVLYDDVEPGLECTSGVVIDTITADDGVEVRELHDGKVQDDDLVVTDKRVRAHLAPGERVIVYRDALGIAVVGAG